jgi:hypothetical protein
MKPSLILISRERCNWPFSPPCFFDTANIAQQRSSLDILTVFEGSQITIEVPLGYTQRDQLLSFMESKFPGAEITIVHSEVSDPTVAEAFVRHDLTNEPAQTASEVPGENSASVLVKASDALLEFIK